MRLRTAAIWAVGVAASAMVARRWLDVVEVRGRSMSPVLVPGDRLLVARARPRPGDVVLASDPHVAGRELIKRVHALADGTVVLHGDNRVASTDARTFGPVPASAVRWRAVARYWPLRRAGRIAAPTDEWLMVDEGGEPACAFPEALVAGPIDDDGVVAVSRS